MTARAGLLAVLAAASVLWAGAARAAELVLFELDGCGWCTKWHAEIGRIYPNTEEGRLLPLRRVPLGKPPRDVRTAQPVTVAPTFVVAECGAERGRVVGYNGEDQFWGELAAIIRTMKAEGRPARC